MYQIKTTPQPPAWSKRREAVTIQKDSDSKPYDEPVSLDRAGSIDDAFYSVLSKILN